MFYFILFICCFFFLLIKGIFSIHVNTNWSQLCFLNLIKTLVSFTFLWSKWVLFFPEPLSCRAQPYEATQPGLDSGGLFRGKNTQQTGSPSKSSATLSHCHVDDPGGPRSRRRGTFTIPDENRSFTSTRPEEHRDTKGRGGGEELVTWWRGEEEAVWPGGTNPLIKVF